METAPAGARGDAADDPAFWLHPDDAAKSLILATNKQAGLVVCNLDGAEAGRLPIGLINNVDVRQSADLSHDVVVASNDQVNAISVFLIERATGTVSHRSHDLAVVRGDLATGRLEPYGICSGREDGRGYTGLTYRNGTVELWSVSASPAELSGELLKTARRRTRRWPASRSANMPASASTR